MDDFFENLNDNLEDRAALMGTVGAISALKNQGRQIGKLDELKEAHEKGNIIEKERLEIERQRFSIEKDKIDDQKAAEQSIKALRRLMLDVGSDLRGLDAKFPI